MFLLPKWARRHAGREAAVTQETPPRGLDLFIPPLGQSGQRAAFKFRARLRGSAWIVRFTRGAPAAGARARAVLMRQTPRSLLSRPPGQVGHQATRDHTIRIVKNEKPGQAGDRPVLMILSRYDSVTLR